MELDIQSLAKEITKHMPVLTQTWPRWLSLKKASDYSQYGQKKLVELATSGKIRGFQDSDLKTSPWVFDRDSIDEYRITQAALANNTDEDAKRQKKVLAIINSVRI